MTTTEPAVRRVDPADAATVRAMLDVERAALAADDPSSPLWSPRVFQARLALGPPHRDPSEAWCLPDDASGGLAGWYYLRLPDLENQGWGNLELMVDPAARRRGLGTALLRHAAGRARAHGRAELYGEVVQGTAGEEFGRRSGARYGLADIRRVLDLDVVSAEHVAQCRERAAKAAAGYSLVSWQGRTPDELIAGVARMFTTMNDAPNGPSWNPTTGTSSGSATGLTGGSRPWAAALTRSPRSATRPARWPRSRICAWTWNYLTGVSRAARSWPGRTGGTGSASW